METRRGTHVPAYPHIPKHCRTTNEELAQLSYAGFLQKPFVAKDKKKTLFNKDYNNPYVINEYYDCIFKYDSETVENCGILFQKSNIEIEELLLVKTLYKEANKFLKSKNNGKIKELEMRLNNSSQDDQIKNNIQNFKKYNEISNIVLFYVVTYYYYVKSNISYEYNIDTSRFYQDKKYKEELISDFCRLYLTKVVKIVDVLSAESSSPATWIRSQKSQNGFLEKISNEISMDFDYEEEIKGFMQKFSKQTLCM